MFNVRLALSSVLLLLASGFVSAADPPLQSSLVFYKPRPNAPDLVLNDLDGRQVNLARLKGKVVVVNFWATWCPPCRREFPSMERLRDNMSGKPLVILAVNEGETADTVEQFVSTLDMQPAFPILLDLNGGAMASWPVRGLPTTYVIDKKGRMAYQAIGGREFDHPEIVKAITRLLSEK
ncbi:MAG: TlpA family protein disulfide reductase [Hydrogenophilaceae bacterium]|jgi:thiol-disulfide isomerase/thioredoxin|nr:TlpA family protein disulfide reductase [Hydrogenophilaceae bacterium]